jgi:hypothetical protein
VASFLISPVHSSKFLILSAAWMLNINAKLALKVNSELLKELLLLAR